MNSHCLRLLIALLVACLLSLPSPARAAAPKPAPHTLALQGKDFQLQGDWVVQTEFHRTVLFATPNVPKYPPAAAIVVPRAGKYRLWVAARDFPNDRPGTRTFTMSIAGKHVDRVFGRSGKDNYEFEDGGWIDLAAGPTLVILDSAKSFARFHGLILSDDPRLVPTKAITPTAYPAAKLHAMELPRARGATLAELKVEEAAPQAVLENEFVRYEFVPARRGEMSTIAVRVQLKTPQGWKAVDTDPAAEGYFINLAPANTKLAFAGFYPVWTRTDLEPITIEVGGVRVATIPSHTTHTQAAVGVRTQCFPKSAVASGRQVRIDFYPTSAGRLTAVWQLLPEQRFADVELSFVSAAEGQVALGYELFYRRDPAKVSELLLPMMYHRKRLPDADVSLLSNTTPTPLALVQPSDEPAAVLALIADPRDIPFTWPDGRTAPYALSIRGPDATVQPAIFGPVLGGSAVETSKSRGVRLRFKVLVQPGDWYAGFRTAADQVFGLRDYRENVRVSLSDAVLNMIDLFLDDDHGGWWERAKAAYQIESKNGSTHSAPMLPLSLYRLTADPRLLERRVLPTLAFMLSRDGAHFSPVPENPGGYPSGTMNGPVKLFGTTTYAGLWELSGHRTPAFREIAAPPGEPRPTAGYSHAAPLDEYLARYQLAGDPKDLEKACEMADKYIQSAIATAPRKDLGSQPFFFISFVPDWEGLLRLYEATGKQSYLDAAAFGARQLMTGLWTQPVIPPGEITIHPTGQYNDHPGLDWWKGPERFRLGLPRKPNDTPAHDVPAWTVSNVGLGFEQPVTYRSSAAGRIIWQMGWSAHFLRLYRYTHDPAFLTCARNAVVGRWGNYPGYYITGLTDLPQNPAYPLTGPDVTEFYYHHITPHLAWSIDYLVSEVEMLSDGAIAFPSLRQYGYAYFDSRIFGHAPGRVYDDPSAWLLLRRGVVSVDNPQLNTLLAWSQGRLHVILSNQSQQPQEATLQAGAKLSVDAKAGPKVTLRTVEFQRDCAVSATGCLSASAHSARVGKPPVAPNAAEPAPLAWNAASRSVKVVVPPRGLATVTLSGVQVDPPARPQFAGDRPSPAAAINLPGQPASTRAAAIQIEPGVWYAYVWSTASPQEARAATLRYQVAGRWQELKKGDYPFEFIVPVADEREPLVFKLDLILPDGAVKTSPEATLRLGR